MRHAPGNEAGHGAPEHPVDRRAQVSGANPPKMCYLCVYLHLFWAIYIYIYTYIYIYMHVHTHAHNTHTQTLHTYTRTRIGGDHAAQNRSGRAQERAEEEAADRSVSVCGLFYLYTTSFTSILRPL
jgi:hypothetical protein